MLHGRLNPSGRKFRRLRWLLTCEDVRQSRQRLGHLLCSSLSVLHLEGDSVTDMTDHLTFRYVLWCVLGITLPHATTPLEFRKVRNELT